MKAGMPVPTAAQLKSLIDVAGDDPVTVTVVGSRGSGRTHLLGELRQLLRGNGVPVLAARSQLATDPALSAYHQVCSAASLHLARLASACAPPNGQALGRAEGLPAAGGGDSASLAKAAAALLQALAREQPVGLLIDDWDRLDEQSVAVLDRLLVALPDRVHVVRTQTDGHGIGSGSGHLVHLPPWDLTRSGRFLDGLKDRPRGQLRHQILVQARGNPLALAELARHLSRHPELQTPPSVPLPLSHHLLAAFAPGLGCLPPPARRLGHGGGQSCRRGRSRRRVRPAP